MSTAEIRLFRDPWHRGKSGRRAGAQFPKGTFARIAAVLAAYEDRTDFVREAMERELQRREAEKKKPTRK